MKTKKEMDVLKEEAQSVNEEMRELTDEELAQVTGGRDLDISGKRSLRSLVLTSSVSDFEVAGFESEHIQVYFDKLIE